MQKNLLIKILIALAIIVYFAKTAYPPQDKINLGLDLKGGMHLVLEVDKSKLEGKAKEIAVTGAMRVLERRIDAMGVAEPLIQAEGENKIIIQLPGVTDRARAHKMIGKTAQLEFRLVSTDMTKSAAGYERKTYKFRAPNQLKASDMPIMVKKEAELGLTGAFLVAANADRDTAGFGQNQVSIEFNAEGAELFEQVSSNNVGRQLAIVLDDEVISAPRIQGPIAGGRARITGDFSEEEARDLAIQLSAGALPAPVEIIEDRTVSESLGTDSVNQGVRAAIFGVALVVVFMGVYYLLAGLIANFALCLNMILIMGVLAYFKATLTLPGIAGLILTIGMAVDANVLIFERIREELATGKKVRASIAAGYDKVLGTILDANITTLIAAFALFKFGTGPVRGFALTLTIGIVASVFTALFVTRIIFDLIGIFTKFENLKMLHFLTKTEIDFLGKKKITAMISLGLIVLGMGYFGYRQVSPTSDNFGIDFKGGTLLQLKFEKAPALDVLRSSLRKINLEGSTIQQIGSDEKDILIKTKNKVSQDIYKQFKADMPDNSFEETRAEEVGPTIGAMLRDKAFVTIFWVLAGILIYISARFELKFAVAAIVALIHDVLITVGAFSLMGKELSTPALAAILTIIGYSLNDTIVVFDRIRENLNINSKLKFSEAINLSINKTLSRTILTSVTTLLVVISLYLFGGVVINDFAFILLIGVIVGTYSSMFVASPVLVFWENLDKKDKK